MQKIMKIVEQYGGKWENNEKEAKNHDKNENNYWGKRQKMMNV